MSDVCEIIIYTISAALSFNVKATTEDFQERLAGALEEGTVILDTVEGSKLILNAINVVATQFAVKHRDEIVLTVNKDLTTLRKTEITGDLTVGKGKFVPASEGLDLVLLD